MATTTAPPSKRPARRRSNGDTGLLQQREAELAAMVARQAATTEILKAMSASPDDPQPVFELIAHYGLELCRSAQRCSVCEHIDGMLHVRAHHGHDAVNVETLRQHWPRPVSVDTVHGRVVLGGRIVRVRDVETDDATEVHSRDLARAFGSRSLLGVPLRGGGNTIGSLVVSASEADAFDEREVALLESFAEQAVIAITSAQTRRELAARNSAYGERIEQQAATIDVLKAMSAIASDAQPVFELITSRARELCGSLASMLFEFDGELLHLRAWGGYDPEAAQDYLRQFPARPNRGTAVGRAILERDIVHIRNIAEDPEIAPSVRTMGVRSTVGIPLLRNRQPIGVIAIGSTTTEGFSDSQIELLKTFAEQAVIAIGSVATFRTLQQRTAELAARNSEYSERIEHQSATIDVLKAMSASPGDPQPVFDLITRRAREICSAPSAGLLEFDGKLAHFRSLDNDDSIALDDAFDAYKRLYPMAPTRSSIVCRAILDRSIVHIRDMESEAEIVQAARNIGHKSVLAVPFIRDGAAAGVIALNAWEKGGFSDSQVELLKTFAEQAVIAIRSAETFRALQQRTRDLSESLEQQTALADVLRAINASPGDPAPVFQLILEKAHSLCGATRGCLFLYDGTHIRGVATHGYPDEISAVLRQPNSPVASTISFLNGERFHHLHDIKAQTELETNVVAKTIRDLSDVRTNLVVPLRKDGTLLGLISANRTEVRPYTASEITLLENFAAQAVIAMENARLLTELRESLEQQTATAEILQVINANPGNLAPVFAALLGKAAHLCRATYGSLLTFDGERFLTEAYHGNPDFDPAVAKPRTPEPGSALARIAAGERIVHILDVADTDEYRNRIPSRVVLVEKFGARTTVWVALRKDDAVLGTAAFYRKEVRAFSDNEIALLQNFAAQAVIAIENARLLGEVRERNAAFAEQVEHQAASIDVLKVMSASTNDTQPVFDIILHRAMDLCGCTLGGIYEFDGELMHARAARGFLPDALATFARQFPRAPTRAIFSARAILDRQTIQIRDIDAESNVPQASRDLGYRSMLAVPLLRGDTAIGVISLAHKDIDGFSDTHVELLKTFAEQAVIAIGSVATFRELQTRTTDLTRSVAELQALEEVLRAVNSSLDLETVLATIIDRAVPLAQADEGTIYEFDATEEVFAPKAAYGMSDDRIARLRDRRIRIGETFLGRSAIERRPIHIADVQQDPSIRAAAELLPGIHAVLALPLLQGEKVIGGMVIRRRSERAFAANTVTLMQTFAGQSVLAIENARLFQDAERARAASESALNDLRRAQDRLIQSEKMASLGQLTAGIAHEIKNPLNFINNFSSLSTELIDELQGVLANAAVDGPTRAEVDELSAMIKGNLEKVEQHGKRADGIVRNMLLHARESGGERRSVDLNATIEEALNLAYHGARAEKPGFNITLEQKYNPAVGAMEIYPQEFTRVMLNLFSNGFYAATRKAHEGAGADFQPTLTVTTEARPAEVLVRVRDNGTGIPDSARARLFEPFFTTKPAGEGTGLGLSLSHDIVVKQHGGSIAVDSRVGDYTEFTITLPRT